jgi:ubiquinone/menaquinone biosynthesis C-methylase UbiE
MEQKRELERWFAADSKGSKWDDMYRDRPPRPDEDNFRQRRDYAVSLVERRCAADAVVLDLGCGAGAATAELVARGRRAVGLDYSADMLQFARERLRERSLQEYALLRGEAGRLPFANGTFACVICLGVISYQDDYSHMLQEIRRVLTPGGTALITFRNVYNPLASDPWKAIKAIGRLILRGERPRDRGMGRLLPPSEVEREIERAGLRCERFEGIGLGPFMLAGRRLLSDRSSIRLSRTVSDALRRIGLRWTLRWSADVVMFECRNA